MFVRIVAAIFVCSLAALCLYAADPPYLGAWSNGRGETLSISKSSLQFADNKPASYRDVTSGPDDGRFELLITAPGNVNAFPGKTIAVECEGELMGMMTFASHAKYLEGKDPLSVVHWYKDSPKVAEAAKPYTPAAGNAERKAIALALHVPIERDLKQKVALKFTQLLLVNDWAMARFEPQQPGGAAIDYSKTKYKEEQAEGMFDAVGEALLKREQGQWRVLEFSFGGTDTAMMEWIKLHRAPNALAQ